MLTLVICLPASLTRTRTRAISPDSTIGIKIW